MVIDHSSIMIDLSLMIIDQSTVGIIEELIVF